MVKEPIDGFYQVTAKPELVVALFEDNYKELKEKSFHLDVYCFDSRPEKTFFEDVIASEKQKRFISQECLLMVK